MMAYNVPYSAKNVGSSKKFKFQQEIAEEDENVDEDGQPMLEVYQQSDSNYRDDSAMFEFDHKEK